MMAVPEELWAKLERGTAEDRVRAARQLAEYAVPSDMDRILRLERAETDDLPRALLSRIAGQLAHNETLDQSPTDSKHVERQATRELASLFLHELSPLLGMLERDLSRAVPDYAGSRAQLTIDRIRAFLDAIRRLQEASTRPVATEIDMLSLVSSVISDVQAEIEAKTGAPLAEGLSVELARSDHQVVTVDPELARLAIANGVRNAMESCLEVDGDRVPRIVVNWGVTDKDVWVAILDEGIGLSPSVRDPFAPSESTKPKSGNLGMGLDIARRAVDGLGGEVQLLPRDPQGARYEVRWPKELQ